MRKVLSLLLAVVLVFGLAAPALAATVNQTVIGTTELNAGEELTITVTLDETLNNLIAFDYELYYDSSLFELISSTKGDVSNVVAKTDTSGNAYVSINKANLSGDGTFSVEAGTLATLTFKALESVTGQQLTSFRLEQESLWDDSWSCENIDDGTVATPELNITINPEPAATYTVTLPENPVGYTVIPAEGSENPVTEGGNFSFTLTVDTENYEGDPVVKANGLSLTQQDGVYTIYNITEDQTITVAGIKEQGLPADKVIYQHGSNGAQWPTGVPVYINALTLKGLAVENVSWDAAYENCTVTLHKKTAVDASYNLAAVVAVAGQPQMISMFSAGVNGQNFTGGNFTYSGSLEDGRAELAVTATASSYTGTKTFMLVVDGAPEPTPETYEVTLTGGEGYTITATEDSFSPVTEGGSFSFTVTVNNGYQGTPQVKVNGSEISDVNGVYTIENITADQVVSVSGISEMASGYAVEVPASTTTTVNGEVTVEVKVSHSDETVTQYNAYDVTVSYDTENLTYVSAAAAHSGAEIKHNETTGTVQIVGYGETKSLDNALATLKFTAKASGIHDVAIETAKVDISDHAIGDDAPEAAVPVSKVQVKVAHTVTLPENFSGDPTVLPGEEYQFTAPSEFYDILVTVGGEKVDPAVDGLVYTISSVNGDVVITAVGKIYNVTKTGTNVTFTGEDTAQHGEDYFFTATAAAGYALSNVSVEIGETAVEYTVDTEGNYIVSGMDIKGDLTITATAVMAEGFTQITFTGVDSSEVVGGLNQVAENGKDFNFQLNKEEGYYYTAMLGENRLNPNEEGIYTIAGAEIKGDPLTVVITKTLLGTLNVEVSQYLTLNKTVMWLVKATMDEQILAYGAGNTMYWSDEYNAYCWLVISAESGETVKNEALAAICVAQEGAGSVKVAYDGDVNQSREVDVNDAQLTYDMYQAKLYEDFTRVTMDKFLEADANGDGVVNVEDAAAIVAELLN